MTEDEYAECDPMYGAVKKSLPSLVRVSIPHVQRTFKLGFNRTQRILETLVEHGHLAWNSTTGKFSLPVAAPQNGDSRLSNAQALAQRLSEVAASIRSDDPDSAHDCEKAVTELRRLHQLIFTPHTVDFVRAVEAEAAYQREKWGTDHDGGKTDADWFWLIGHLAGKALNKPEKQLHHIITTAAACLNWHAARTGADTRMRPGIMPPVTDGGNHNA